MEVLLVNEESLMICGEPSQRFDSTVFILVAGIINLCKYSPSLVYHMLVIMGAYSMNMQCTIRRNRLLAECPCNPK